MKKSELKTNKTDSASAVNRPDQKKETTNVKESSTKRTSDYKEWEIDEATAKKLMDNRRKPGNDSSNIVDYNDDIRNQIDRAYSTAKKTWQEARYKDEEDEIRYSRLRHIPDDNDGSRGNKGRVKGYKTKIYMVVSDGKPTTSTTYYDIATIHPPPPDSPKQ